MIISDGPGPVEVKLILQEHKCVLDSCRALEMEGFRVTYLPVQKNGLIDLKVSGPGVRGRVGILECQWESVGNGKVLVTVIKNFYGIIFVISIYQKYCPRVMTVLQG